MTTTYLQKLRLINRDARLLLISIALFGLAFFGVHMVLLNLYLLRLGHGLKLVGSVFGVLGLMFALGSLPAGVMGRRWGSRRTMILGYCLISIGLVLPPLALFTPVAWRAAWLLITYSLGVAGASLYSVNGSVFLMGATAPEERSHAFSVQTALSPLAAFVGSLIGGFLPGVFAALLSR